MGRPEQEGNVAHRLVGEEGEAFWVDLQDLISFKLSDRNKVFGQQAIFRLVRTYGVRILVGRGLRSTAGILLCLSCSFIIHRHVHPLLSNFLMRYTGKPCCW